MKSTNPIFNESVYEQAYALTERPMTVAGTTNKLLILSLIKLKKCKLFFYFSFSSSSSFFYIVLFVCPF